jgi:hypothetical protein
MQTRLILPSLVLLMTASSCLPCTDQGCSDALVIKLVDTEDMVYGEYGVTVTAGDKSYSCDEFWGEDPNASGGGAGGQGGSASSLPEIEMPSGCRQFSNTFYFDYDENKRPTRLTISQPERELLLEITLDDAVIFTKTIKPDYEEEYPNGKRCGPECSKAVETVSLNSSTL